MKSAKPGSKFYEGGIRVIKNGVPHRFPAWWKSNTATHKARVMQGPDFCRPMGRTPMKKIQPHCGCESCAEKALAATLGIAAE